MQLTVPQTKMRERVEYYKNQNYSKLKKSCIKQQVLFEDPLFPASLASLYYRRTPPGTIEWKRPKEICQNPRLFVDGISSRDLNQGSLGNCWFVAAASCLATKLSMWKKVIPNHSEQDWNHKDPGRHAGIFHFRFWRFGSWLDICIDDRLPTINGHLIFCHSNDINEFWCALLEKAYAKLNGCYEALEGGNTAEALVDFTGGISEPVVMDKENFTEELEKRKKLFQRLLKAHSRQALISCSIRPGTGEEIEAQMACGLVKGHAYGVTDIRKVRIGKGVISWIKANKLYMIRMRNPWGTSEWKGPWSCGSNEWKQISKKMREKMGVTVTDDGEFWMDFKDFCYYFTDMVISRQINTSFLSFHKTWVEARILSEWNVSASRLQNRSGGCINNRSTFFQNPQFRFDVVGEESALVCLQQEDQRVHKKEGGGENLAMGFEIFKVEVNRKYRMHAVQQKISSSAYIDSRSIFLRSELTEGRYVIVPTTFSPGETGKFLVRLFTDRKANLRELTLDQPKSSFWKCLVGYPKRVTSVTVHSGAGLRITGQNKEPDTYVIIRCEGTKIKSRVQKSNSKPDYNLKALFYRKKPKRPIKIQVWSCAFPRDIFLGEVSIAANVNEIGKSEVCRLEGNPRDYALGSVLVETSSSDDLTAI
ncbi:calpain-5-like [Protopterus annectens]|uniref:calpain-5-like n=1 Tax=Protopterus annectens TaxID=7888 RepID=UPI001CFAA119|nr:calpain-5-like [Protopterus annectens]